MNEFLGKLVDLSYELVGVFLPGVILTVFVLIWWGALGPLAPFWTNDVVSELTWTLAVSKVDALRERSLLGTAVVALVFWYLFGHMLLWTARSGKKNTKAEHSWPRRTGLTLLFRLPKPPNHYNPDLEPLLKVVAKELAFAGKPLDWRQFYPVAKSLISERLTRSLVRTYQNKYTLHRSIATGSAFLFWLSLIALIASCVTYRLTGLSSHWVLLLFLSVFSLLIIGSFSASYMYHWEMYGNTVITESFSLLRTEMVSNKSNESK